MAASFSKDDATVRPLALLVKSFKAHFDRLALLFESLEQKNVDDVPVYLVLPHRDIGRRGGPWPSNTHVICEEDLILDRYSLKRAYRDNLARKSLRRLGLLERLTGRECYRGALVQQLCKLALPAALCDRIANFVILDSDLVFIRPFKESAFLRDRQGLLIEIPIQSPSAPLIEAWALDAGRFLGLADEDLTISNWIATGTCWNAHTVRRLLDHIQTRHGMHWQSALMRYPFRAVFQDRPFFSEFQLVGAFNRHLNQTPQPVTRQPNTLNLWSRNALDRFLGQPPDSVKEVLRGYLLLGVQKDFAGASERRKIIRYVGRILDQASARGYPPADGCDR